MESLLDKVNVRRSAWYGTQSHKLRAFMKRMGVNVERDSSRVVGCGQAFEGEVLAVVPGSIEGATTSTAAFAPASAVGNIVSVKKVKRKKKVTDGGASSKQPAIEKK
ncbi:doublecortin domain-containing protein 5 [Sesbania bispinosa]|nr:doublecortin domain-containing protein 5 [Sesbania bispinosa]